MLSEPDRYMVANNVDVCISAVTLVVVLMIISATIYGPICDKMSSNMTHFDVDNFSCQKRV